LKLAELQAALAQRATRADPVADALDARIRERAEAHLGALSQTFPVTAAVLGPAYWRTLLQECWEGPGSSDADLTRYGAFVPGLLAEATLARPELEPLGYVAELASLEWAVHEAVARTGPERFDWGAFARLSESAQAHVPLVPSPALAKRRLVAPVDEIWRRHRGGEPSEEGGAGPYLCCLHPTGRFDVGVERWDPRAEAVLDQLLAGATLASLEALDSLDVTRLHGWIEAGWIIGFAPAD
jgi:hypothetical protein